MDVYGILVRHNGLSCANVGTTYESLACTDTSLYWLRASASVSGVTGRQVLAANCSGYY